MDFIGSVFWIALLLGIGFVVVCCVIKFRADESEAKENATAIDNQLSSLNSKIDATYRLYFGNSSLSSADKLAKIHTAAMKLLDQEKQKFISSNAIARTSDTSSDLSLCGVSKTHFYTKLDKFSFIRVYTYSDLDKKYRNAVDYHHRADFETIQVAVDDFEKLKNRGASPSGVKAIPLDDILYFKIEGSVSHLSNVQGGGVNMQGAVAGAIIGGGAAAIIGSQLGTETKTEIVTKDDRKVLLYTKSGENIKTQNLGSNNVDNTIAALRNLIPSKEESVVQLESRNTPTPSAISPVEELKKFKELLDAGILSQEEFDAKKGQLLGIDTVPKLHEPENSFKMQVVDYFTWRGKGLCVRGEINEGTICLNDNVEIKHLNGTSTPATVNTIVLNEQSAQTATVGDDVALILSDVTKYDMQPGDFVIKK